MSNHFHLLVRIKEEEKDQDLTGLFSNTVKNLLGLREENKLPHQYFSNLFNAYTKAFNKYNNRHGALFERPFKRKIIDLDEYLKQVILYIHNNPVHHGFVEDPIEYGWSSYLTCTSEKETKLQREEVLNWFEDKENFEYCHRNYKPDSIFNLSAFEM